MHTHKAKKYLGQNFLKSEAALRKIVEAGELRKDDVVLEIGPGKGVLTARLLENAGFVVAVEKDYGLVEFLREKFGKNMADGSFTLIHGDILDFDPERELPKGTYKLIANIPYNITGAVLKKFLTAGRQPERMVLMIQHEVAQRIMARDKKESVLSISIKAYGTPSLVMKVPARYFSPAPMVDSAIISIRGISRSFFRKNGIREETFWEIVKKGFAHKRKKLSSNLKSVLKNKDGVVLSRLGNKRAENITLEEWIMLAE